MLCLGTVAAQPPWPRRLRRRRLRSHCGAGRWQPPPAAEHLLPAPSAPRLLLRGGGGTETASAEAVEAEGDQLRRDQPGEGGQAQGSVPSSQLPRYMPHRLLLSSTAPRSRVQVEGRRIGKAPGAALGSGPPFAHPLRCWERADSPEPRRGPFTSHVRTQAPKLFLSVGAYWQNFEVTGKDDRILCRRKTDRIWPFPTPGPHV